MLQMLRIIQSFVMLVAIVALTLVFAVDSAFAESSSCKVTLDSPCTEELTTGDELEVFLDGNGASVSIIATDESHSYGATLSNYVDDEKQPDIALRPDHTVAVSYKLPSAKEVKLDNVSQNADVKVLITVKELPTKATYYLFNQKKPHVSPADEPGMNGAMTK